MTTLSLIDFSNQLADVVDATASVVVQVHGGGRPASGVAYGATTVLTNMRALGREDGLRVRTPDGGTHNAELKGWDPATGLAVLEAADAALTPAAPSNVPARVGQIALAVGRSWSNAVTATLGVVAVIGGPLKTGRGRSIEQIIRTTAPMHSGFAGGALVSAGGLLVGIATAASIRGLGVVIPAGIAWSTAASVLKHGRPKVGYLGISGQPVTLDRKQRETAGGEGAMLVVGISPDSPAEAAGLQVGDALLSFDGQDVRSPDDLIARLTGERVGQRVPLRVLRGGALLDLDVTVAERTS